MLLLWVHNCSSTQGRARTLGKRATTGHSLWQLSRSSLDKRGAWCDMKSAM